MQAPRFWYGAGGRDSAPLIQALLTPLGWAYAAAGARRLKRGAPHRCAAPVICVGNLTLGGTGKTPVVRALRARLAARGLKAASLSRGYGGALEGPLQVDLAAHGPGDVGDEPLLHAADGLAFIARDRVAGAEAAVRAGAQAILLDDGFQNPALAKDLSLLVFDGGVGVGNGRVFPAGPLREPVAAGLSRADGLVLIGGPRETPDWLEGFERPIIAATLEPVEPPPTGPLYAFAGIGRPAKFFDTLAAHGAQPVDGASFPDHHVYAESELVELARRAEGFGARLITTEKDFVRLPAAWRDKVLTLPVAARFADPAAVDALLDRIAPREGR